MAGFTNKTIGGFRYWGSVFGENIVPRLLERQVASAYGTAVFCGDPVNCVSDGSVDVAAAGQAIWGVVARCQYNKSGKLEESNHIPASTTYTQDYLRSQAHCIAATPYTIFEVDADEGTSITTVAAARELIWENCDHATGTGDTVSGRSAAVLDISTHGTGAAGWRIIGISDATPNNVTVTRAKYLVVANETDAWPGTFSTTGV